MVTAQTFTPDSQNIAPVDLDALMEQYGVTASQVDEATEKLWKWKFTQAKNESDARRKNATIRAHAEKDLKSPVGELVI